MTKRQVDYAMTVVADLRAIERNRDRPDGVVPVRADIRDVAWCWNIIQSLRNPGGGGIGN